MKKLAVLVGVVAIFAWGTGAWADFSLTFDGSQDLTSGAGYASGANDIIVTNQYAGSGVNFSDPTSGNLSSRIVASNNVSIGGSQYTLGGATFGYATPATNYWLDDGTGAAGTATIGNGATTTGNYITNPTSNFLGFNKGSGYNAGALVTFTTPLTSLSFDLYRPGGTGGSTSVVDITLFEDGTPVGSTTYSVTVNNSNPWVYFNSSTLDPSGSPFDEVLLDSTKRFMVDNLDAPATVPMPPAALLFLTGLGGFALLKRRVPKA
jgi:hypothetical protein